MEPEPLSALSAALSLTEAGELFADPLEFYYILEHLPRDDRASSDQVTPVIVRVLEAGSGLLLDTYDALVLAGSDAAMFVIPRAYDNIDVRLEISSSSADSTGPETAIDYILSRGSTTRLEIIERTSVPERSSFTAAEIARMPRPEPKEDLP